ncbi:tetratricopeptide repeat protein 27-like [Uloborus diversus]|uniref:tetratricopeptide repeat protein 27-like n=1 Tax=Uloborus diversus TaxID=327109 RepID=UPI0024090BFF|nr:tetratricopeptide repeat protein 27-like [Uloborus diversus]
MENKIVISRLQELEIRCLLCDFQNYEFSFSDYFENYKLKETFECLIRNIINQDYEIILNLKLSKVGFNVQSYVKHSSLNDSDCNLIIEKRDDYFRTLDQYILLFIGVSALQEFLKVNITGPISVKTENFQVVNDIISDKAIVKSEIEKLLSRDGEFIYTNVNNPELLYCSQLFLNSIDHNVTVSSKWWLVRCLFAHQMILPERNVFLYKKIKILLDEIFSSSWINKSENSTSKLLYLTEAAQMYLYYHEVLLAKKCLEMTHEITGLEIILDGAMGKRTQHQQKPVAQLFVKTQRSGSEIKLKELEYNNNFFPCNVALNDDTLLNNVKFVDEENTISNLSVFEQVVILCHCCLIKRSSSFDELLHEEVLSYVNSLLLQPKVWCIYVKALILRCQLEKSSSRRIERALMQLEAIVNALKSEKPTFSVRQYFLFSSAFPTYWILEKELADLLLSIGATKSALEIYERLQLWEDIIVCYQRLGRTHSAEKLISEQLEKKETPLLWCLMGDVTENPNNYLKAWDLSEHKSARAQRSLGYYYFKNKNYKESITHFEKTLELNHLQLTVWFSLGYAATQIEDFELAAKAYRQVVTLDTDNFEAWNNLSNAYIKTKQKLRAWRSLQEALKCNYEEWRVWENFLLVSIDVGAFEDVIQCWHRLLDIKGKHQDSEVLAILVNAILKDLPDVNDVPASRLRKRTLELFGRLTSIITNDSQIWELYSSLYSYNDECFKQKDVTEKAYTFQQKAVRCQCVTDQWEKDFILCRNVLKSTLKMAQLCLSYIKHLEDELKLQQKSSAKLSIQNVVTRSKKCVEYFSASETEELLALLSSLSSVLDDILSN